MGLHAVHTCLSPLPTLCVAWIPGMGPCWRAAHPLPLHTLPPTNGLLKSPLHLQTAYSGPCFAIIRHGDGARRQGGASGWAHALYTHASHPCPCHQAWISEMGPCWGAVHPLPPPLHAPPPTNNLLRTPLHLQTSYLTLHFVIIWHGNGACCLLPWNASEWACTLCTHASHPVIIPSLRDGPVLGSCTPTPPAHTSAYKQLTQGAPPTYELLT